MQIAISILNRNYDDLYVRGSRFASHGLHRGNPEVFVNVKYC